MHPIYGTIEDHLAHKNGHNQNWLLINAIWD